jgi:hypothetical protein
MFVFRQLAEIRQLTDIPEPPHHVARRGPFRDVGIIGKMRSATASLAGRARARPRSGGGASSDSSN